MRRLLRMKLTDLRKEPKYVLLSHVESRLATLSKRSVAAQNDRNEVMGRTHVELSRLNAETLAYMADALNKVERT